MQSAVTLGGGHAWCTRHNDQLRRQPTEVSCSGHITLRAFVLTRPSFPCNANGKCMVNKSFRQCFVFTSLSVIVAMHWCVLFALLFVSALWTWASPSSDNELTNYCKSPRLEHIPGLPTDLLPRSRLILTSDVRQDIYLHEAWFDWLTPAL